MAIAEAPAANTFVLRIPTVAWCIEQLLERKIHPFFLAYLHLRQIAINQDAAEVRAHWPDLAKFLDMPGGPPGKPYFRPFWNQSRAGGQEWLNENIAGSYAGSSLRARPLKVLGYEDGAFEFPERHWEAAREHLLYGKRIPAAPLAGFLYRDFAFQTDGAEPTPNDLVTIFRQEFRYYEPPDAPDDEFNYIFDPGFVAFGDAWFEPFSPTQVEANG